MTIPNPSASRFAGSVPARRAIPEPVKDFAMISLESVEALLRDTTNTSATAAPSGYDWVPPPLFGTGTAPAKPAPAPLPAPRPVPPGTFRFESMVRPDGTVDTDAVYRYAQVPPVRLSAELILQALANLPAEVPERARRAAIAVTVNSLAQAANIPVATVLEDAKLRQTRITQFADALAAESGRDAEPLNCRVAELEARLAATQAELNTVCETLAAHEQKIAPATYDCARLIARLQEVVDCLEDAPPASSSRTDELGTAPMPDELPPHLRDDSVRRLLGIADDLPEA